MKRIYLEGKRATDKDGNPKTTSEEYFIRALLSNLKGDDLWSENIRIIPVGGWANWADIEPILKESMDEPNDKNYIIFDADSEEKCKNTGGCKKRTAAINGKKEKLRVEFDLFLFPNNEDDGDVECLWEKIINSAHQQILTCFEGFETCLRQHVDTNGNLVYLAPNQKNKMHTYVSSQKIQKKEGARVTTQHLLNDGKFNKMRSLKLNWYIWNAMPILTYRLTINILQFLLCERFNF